MYQRLFKMDGKISVCKSCGGKAGAHKSDCSAEAVQKSNPKGINQYTKGRGSAKGKSSAPKQMEGYGKPFKGPAFAGGGWMHTPLKGGMAEHYPKPSKSKKSDLVEARAGIREFVRELFTRN